MQTATMLNPGHKRKASTPLEGPGPSNLSSSAQVFKGILEKRRKLDEDSSANPSDVNDAALEEDADVSLSAQVCRPVADCVMLRC
jgi:hypothetical protein